MQPLLQWGQASCLTACGITTQLCRTINEEISNPVETAGVFGEEEEVVESGQDAGAYTLTLAINALGMLRNTSHRELNFTSHLKDSTFSHTALPESCWGIDSELAHREDHA